MRFNSRDLGVKLMGMDCGEFSDCGSISYITCDVCTNCTNPTNKTPPQPRDDDERSRKHCKHPSGKPETRGSHLAGLKLLREQLRKSLDSAAR
jgi:hypothetical protein